VRLIQEFEWSSFSHIYRELNKKANQLSKEALECYDGSFIAKEFYDGKEIESLEFHF
jgi:hypothetical protein